ncbi:hypothetical protein [Flavobacterium sp.]|uniref:hypothetical protein n=1 Tax=Flavobacterium sp. TaxID=239 RepID=UPI003752BD76
MKKDKSYYTKKIICDSKLDFTTRDSVSNHIKLLNKVGIIDYYKCNVCKNFHTATMQGKKKVSERRESSRHKRETTENRIKKFR